jgi:hypothetical protein
MIDESLEAVPIPTDYVKFFPIQLKFPPQKIYRVCFSIWMSWTVGTAQGAAVKCWEIIADALSKAGWSWGCVSAIDSNGRTIFVADGQL